MESQYVLLYYCYSKIENPEEFRDQHHQLCLDLNLRGRIIVASEGLNGTVSGGKEGCEQYMEAVLSDSRFSHTEFKVDTNDTSAFEKLHVRVKPEIVHSSLHHIDPNQQTGGYVEPAEFREILKEQDEDTIILDVRSNYEHNIGKFKNAITLDIDNFRDFPEKIKELEQYKDKKIEQLRPDRVRTKGYHQAIETTTQLYEKEKEKFTENKLDEWVTQRKQDDEQSVDELLKLHYEQRSTFNRVMYGTDEGPLVKDMTLLAQSTADSEQPCQRLSEIIEER